MYKSLCRVGPKSYALTQPKAVQSHVIGSLGPTTRSTMCLGLFFNLGRILSISDLLQTLAQHLVGTNAIARGFSGTSA